MLELITQADWPENMYYPLAESFDLRLLSLIPRMAGGSIG